MKRIRVNRLWYSPASEGAPEVCWVTQQGNVHTATETIELRGPEIDKHLSVGLAKGVRDNPRVVINTSPFSFEVPEGFLCKTETNNRTQKDGTVLTFTQLRYASNFVASGNKSAQLGGYMNEDGTISTETAIGHQPDNKTGGMGSREAQVLGAETVDEPQKQAA